MEPSSWLYLGAALLCLLLVALASAVEAALAHVSRHKLRQLAESAQQNPRRARSVDRLLDRPRAYGTAMIVLGTLAGVLFVGLFAALAVREALPGGVGLAVAIAAPLLLLFGQGIPRALAHRDPERAGAALAGFAWIATGLVRPLIALYDLLVGALLWPFQRGGGVQSGASNPPPTEEEFTVLIGGGENGDGFEGVIEEDEREMIDGILHLEDRFVRDIMVPRIDIVAMPVTSTLAEVVTTIERAGHSRVPVYDGSVDHLVGVLYAKDLLGFLAKDRPFVDIASVVRPVHYVPETKPVDELLDEFRQRNVHMVVVADEYGGTAGVVTIEDVLEEIVGEIHDEYDVTTEPPLEEVSDRELLVDGRVAAEEVSELLDLGWTKEEHGSIGGLVQRELGRLPSEGEELDYDGVHITVLAVDRHRLRRLRIEKVASGDATAASDGSVATAGTA